jgi:hypothetical protein
MIFVLSADEHFLYLDRRSYYFPISRQRARTQAPKKSAPKKQAPRRNSQTGGSSGLPQALAGLLSNLPPEGQGWTQEKRDKFIDTFGVVLDFCFPINEDEAVEAGAEEAELI